MRWVLFLVAVGRLAAQGCGYQLTPQFFDGTNGSSIVPAAGATYTITISGTVPTCSWAAATTASWIAFNPATGQGNGTFSFTVAPNPAPAQRNATINFSGNWHIPVIQAGIVCTLEIAPTSATADVAGSQGSLAVQTACGWNAYSNNSWIGLSPPTNGTGNGSVNYNVAANACLEGRTGSITVGAPSLSAAFTITQSGSPANLTISPQTASVDATGGSGAVTVNIGSGCPWTYYTDQSWIQIVGGGTGSGRGSAGLSYNIPKNTGPARTAHIYIGPQPQVFTITQAAPPAPIPQVTAVVNAASYASGPIAPGEVIAIGGSLLGPTKGVAAQLGPSDKVFPATLAGVQVLFDGKYAAIPYYVSAIQINAIAPFEIAGQTTTQIAVSYQGGTSAPFQAQVQPAAPGIFTLDYSGAGQGAILNQDYSVNGTSNAAPRGSTVMIYGIGMGGTNPAGADGSITPGLAPLVLQPVSVTIDGIPAQVTYAGGAPGAVAGLIQINAVVPASARTGASVPLSIQIGSWQTQAGVTLAVQ
jgi:uncharacterized protein (TIGR03437 family)